LTLGVAHAFPQEHLSAARQALIDGDRKDARSALDAAEAAFQQTDLVVLNDVLASYWFYRGVFADSRRKSSAAMEFFRQALVVDGTYAWDREVSDKLELRKMFEALRGEVQGREQRSPKVPEATGCAVAYIDGTKTVAEDTVSVGLRLAQVQCLKGDVYSQWIDFSEDDALLDWLALCPYEVDTSIEAFVAASDEDDFASLGVDFGGDAPVAAGPCALAAASEAPESSVPAEEEEAESSDEPKPKPKKEKPKAKQSDFFAKEQWPVGRLVVTGGGVGLMGTSLIMHAGIVRPSFAMVEYGRRNNEWLTPNAADVLTQRYVERRAMTWAVGGVGAAATAAGLVLLRPKTTAAVQPLLLPGGAGLHGRF
jgi:hypothetical protein